MAARHPVGGSGVKRGAKSLRAATGKFGAKSRWSPEGARQTFGEISGTSPLLHERVSMKIRSMSLPQCTTLNCGGAIHSLLDTGMMVCMIGMYS